MAASSDTSNFHEQITQRLEASKADVEKHQGSMDRYMQELEEREKVFYDVAEQIRNETLVPVLAAFAEYFDNAQLEDEERGHCVRCQLRHSIRFPAVAHFEFRVSHDEKIENLTILYEAKVIPVFIRFDRNDILEIRMKEFERNRVCEWVESKVLGFLDSYLQIESHEQYQRDNVALDPVCGMRVAKPKGLAHEYGGQTYYFCAQRCLSRFVEKPESFVHSSSN